MILGHSEYFKSMVTPLLLLLVDLDVIANEKSYDRQRRKVRSYARNS